jgi:hypothetical protein
MGGDDKKQKCFFLCFGVVIHLVLELQFPTHLRVVMTHAQGLGSR